VNPEIAAGERREMAASKSPELSLSFGADLPVPAPASRQ
jgi:hypothetical protein